MTYIFDLDGTLIDSMPQWSYGVLHFLDDAGIEYPENVLKIITPLGTKGSAEYLISLGVRKSVDEILEEMSDFAVYEYANNIPAKPHVAEKLRELKKCGHSLNVLTASAHNLLDVCLQRLEIYDLFDNVWSSDDFDYKKSEPEIYLQAAKRLGVPAAKCIFADDNVNALTAAKNAGMTVIGVFDETSAEYESEIRSIADRYILDFNEL